MVPFYVSGGIPGFLVVVLFLLREMKLRDSAFDVTWQVAKREAPRLPVWRRGLESVVGKDWVERAGLANAI